MKNMVFPEVTFKDKIFYTGWKECIDVQYISNCQENVKELLTQRAEVLLKVNQINRNMKDITHTVNDVSDSQDSIKNILKDLYDIINDMNRYDRNEPQDFKLLQKIDNISKGMTQVNLGQELRK